uniref:KIB1-4 beta-propeller domain-containing protein n=1 Tax=Chenopodium quinoa TaxID=63459 RepID=A0A803LQS9_CHEQI
MLFDKTQRLAFWRPGQHEWSIPDVQFKVHQVSDVYYFKGEFYAVDICGQVMAFGCEVMKRRSRIVANLDVPKLPELGAEVFPYLVEVENTLLVIFRIVFMYGYGHVNEDKYWTESFEIFELNVDDGKFKQVQGVGEHAIFLGSNSTFSVHASSYKHGCKANCIYFTDVYREAFLTGDVYKGGSDMGIYSMKERKTIERLYEGPSQFCDITPPMLVERPHF